MVTIILSSYICTFGDMFRRPLKITLSNIVTNLEQKCFGHSSNKLRTVWPKNWDSFSDKRSRVFCTVDVTCSLSGIKRPQCEANYLPRFTANVNNVWRYKEIKQRGYLQSVIFSYKMIIGVKMKTKSDAE